MKQVAFIVLLTGLNVVLGAQPEVHLYRNDRVISREDPTPLHPEWAPFYHGVASGDPLPDRVIIWTRVTPAVMDGRPVEVRWQVAADPGLRQIVRAGAVTTGPGRDYTVKVDVDSLQAGVTYYYGFTALGKNSLTGKTKTTPANTGIEHLKFGVVSCSNYQAGYFNAYQRLAERTDLDAILHLGDYIYEYGNGEYGSIPDDRPLAPATEIVTLEDYRTRYSTYRLDTSLVRAHQQHAFITVWDDHESANDAYADGAQNHESATEGPWNVRKAAAKQAYFEWMPIRDTDNRHVYRRIRYGDLMDLILLDTRLEGREEQILDPFDPRLQDSTRTLLGASQKTWFFDRLNDAGTRWKILGQQVIFAPFEVGWGALLDGNPLTRYADAQGLAQDIWNGYPVERRQVLRFLRERKIEDVVILTGDFHATFAFDLPETPVSVQFEDQPGEGLTPIYTPGAGYDPATGAGSLAVEFATPSITSANFDENFGSFLTFFFQQLINRPVTTAGGRSLGNPNPHLKYPELSSHGYVILDVRPDSVQADWFFAPILELSPEQSAGQSWYTRRGENRLRRAAAPTLPKTIQDTPAPAEPPTGDATATTTLREEEPFVLLGVYPNPFRETNTLHYALSRSARIQVDLYNTAGTPVRKVLDQTAPPGLYNLELNARDLAAGAYLYRIRVGDQVYTVRVIRAK